MPAFKEIYTCGELRQLSAALYCQLFSQQCYLLSLAQRQNQLCVDCAACFEAVYCQHAPRSRLLRPSNLIAAYLRVTARLLPGSVQSGLHKLAADHQVFCH